jgi:hypothetical protein
VGIGARSGCSLPHFFSHSFYFFLDRTDPDLPVAGVGKYLAASAQLFAHADSTCDLLAVATIDAVPPSVAAAGRGGAAALRGGGGVLVLWRIEGTVNLPWHPIIKPYYGATLYELQPRASEAAEGAATTVAASGGLVARATEWWSVHAADAFLAAVAPAAAARIFGTTAAAPAAALRAQGLSPLLAQLHGFPPALAAAATEVGDWRARLRDDTQTRREQQPIGTKTR